MEKLTHKNLHDYQVRAIKHLINNRYCALFLEMGLGKTVSTLYALDFLIKNLNIGSVLIVAPKMVVETVWQEEAEAWGLKHLTFSKIVGDRKKRLQAIEKPANVYVISRDNIAWLADVVKKPFFDTIVIDELSSFKSRATKRFKALKKFRSSMFRVIGLTGTPIPNSYLDLWSQIAIIDGGKRLGRSLTEYRTRHFDAFFMGSFPKYTLRPGHNKIIDNSISDICLSMLAKDYLNLPDKITKTIRIKLSAQTMIKYEELKKHLILKLIEAKKEAEEDVYVTAANAGVLTNKLIQMCNGAIYDDDKNVINVHDEKIEALEELLETIPGNILLVYNYKHDLDRLSARLSSYNPVKLTNTQQINDWNAGKIKLMLVHPASVGHGLNLQSGGSTIVWFSTTWSLELYQQLNSRLHRQGQSKPVFIYHLCCTDSIEELVLKALAFKDKSQNSLMVNLQDNFNKYLTTFEHGT